ncbi:MAG TPA: hypothetical protein VJA21_00645 [Verrucomicrobiae bacterium]
MPRIFAVLLSLCLGLFIADAAVSAVDDSLILFFGIRVLSLIRGTLFLFAILMAMLTYGLMGLSPMIPKRLFLPVTLFYPVTGLVLIPFCIYFYPRIQLVAWVISLSQVIFGLSILYLLHGGFRFRWPLVAERQLGARRFSWLNLSAFLLVNIVVLVPAAIIYLVVCAALAVDHFSEGFLTLRPAGLTVQVRKYVRDDGRTIQLFPMSHIGEPDFYRKLSHSFPTNSTTLMEGVTDSRNLLTNKITYRRMATSLGLAEQQREFRPRHGKLVWADVDVEQFDTNTIGFLNLIMRVHSKGVNADTVLPLVQYSPPPHFEEQLFDDLLRKRNRRLLEQIHSQLSQSENIVVPWGVAHMPEIAEEIQKSGFRLKETRDYVVIRFRSGGDKSRSAEKQSDDVKAK